MSVREASTSVREPAPLRPAPVSSRFLRSELGMVFRRRRNQAILAVLAGIPIVIAVAIRVTAGGRIAAGWLRLVGVCWAGSRGSSR